MELKGLEKVGPKGQGYFCEVTLYRDTKDGKEYALKSLKKNHYSNDEYRYRLRREITLLQELNECDQIISLIKHGNNKETKSLWYLMPFAPFNLFKYIKKYNQELTIDQRFSIADQVISAIKYAHQKNILHRDISPNNVLLFKEPTVISIKVSDFGLGKNEDSLSFYTSSSASNYGQPLYVSPEQRVQLKDATNKSDIYSLGKIIYFIFTGKDPDNLKQFELSALVAQAIEENPQDRFQNIQEFENRYLALKKLYYDQEIPIDYITLKDLIQSDTTFDWNRFHVVAVKANYSNHVYDDYLSPVISILIEENRLRGYYQEIGPDILSLVEVLSKRIDECLQTVNWPFASTSSFGKLLKNIIVIVPVAEIRLICFKQLWRLAYIADQWAVQTILKTVLDKKFIDSSIEISLADYIQSNPIEIDISDFSNLNLPTVVKKAIIQCNENYKNSD